MIFTQKNPHSMEIARVFWTLGPPSISIAQPFLTKNQLFKQPTSLFFLVTESCHPSNQDVRSELDNMAEV